MLCKARELETRDSVVRRLISWVLREFDSRGPHPRNQPSKIVVVVPRPCPGTEVYILDIHGVWVTYSLSEYFNWRKLSTRGRLTGKKQDGRF